MRVGILTGGGDCPGLNAVIRAVVKVGARRFDHEHVGVLRGWRGLMEQDARTLAPIDVSGILAVGGTILKSSRANPFKDPEATRATLAGFTALGLDALVAIGGEDTLGAASRLHAEFGLNVVGVPKTIDNDLSGTDFTFGFDTAVQIATFAIDRLHTTAESHDRVMVVEVMGRHAGWIALHSGIAGGADHILIPENPPDTDGVINTLRRRHDRGQDASIVVVSEGVDLGDGGPQGERDEFGHAHLAQQGVGDRLGAIIREATGFDTRVTVLGHIQRGGTPTARDRVLATRFGTRAAEMVAEGLAGRMAALHGNIVTDVPLADAVGSLKTVPEADYRLAEPFFA
ncbi:MAG: 6-phosphofructokinase [Thermoleophilia bacterium]|nr:6-phosphofructokinase [Thermoleophilia bacterium]